MSKSGRIKNLEKELEQANKDIEDLTNFSARKVLKDLGFYFKWRTLSGTNSDVTDTYYKYEDKEYLIESGFVPKKEDAVKKLIDLIKEETVEKISNHLKNV